MCTMQGKLQMSSWLCTRESIERAWRRAVGKTSVQKTAWNHTWWGTQMVSHAHSVGRNSIENWPYSGIWINTLDNICTTVTPVGKADRMHVCSSFTIFKTEERPFKCGDCGVCYKRESNLITHHRDTYMGLQPFLCKVCNKAFSIISLLKEHMRVHTGERPFMCPRCGKKFSKKLTSRNTPKKACR